MNGCDFDRQGIAWIPIQSRLILLATQFIDHVISGDALLDDLLGDTATRRDHAGGWRRLKMVADHGTAYGTDRGRDHAAGTIADLIAKHTPCDCPDRGARA